MKECDDEYFYILGADGLKTINVGDLVSWSEMPAGVRRGIVKSKYVKQVGGRNVAYAEILSMNHDIGSHTIEEKLIASLYVMSSRKE